MDNSQALVQLVQKCFNDDIDDFRAWFNYKTGGDEILDADDAKNVIEDNLDNVRAYINEATQQAQIDNALHVGRQYSHLYRKAQYYQKHLDIGQFLIYSDANKVLRPLNAKDYQAISLTINKHMDSLDVAPYIK